MKQAKSQMSGKGQLFSAAASALLMIACSGCARSTPPASSPAPSASRPATAPGAEQGAAPATVSATQRPTPSPTQSTRDASVVPPSDAAATNHPAVGSARLPASLDTRAILADTGRISAFGVRRGGSRAEHAAADFILGRLKSLGYAPAVQAFALPGGQTSRNVTIVIPGSDPRRIVLSAHIDSRVPAPGANDDAVGCAALLALAGAARGRQLVPTLEIDFFGSEEYRDATPGAHHFGSRARVASMSKSQLRRVAGMVTLDVIAVGDELHTRTMGRGPLTMSNLLLRAARRRGVRMTYLRDPGSTGWSDHESYENAGVPVAWVERLTDPAYHTAGDTAGRLTAQPVAETMGVVLEALNSLDSKGLDTMR